VFIKTNLGDQARLVTVGKGVAPPMYGRDASADFQSNRGGLRAVNSRVRPCRMTSPRGRRTPS
jgi:hypothetical protein